MNATPCNTGPLCFFDPRWPVLYEDNHLLAVYKPSGLLVQGDRTGDVCLLDLGKRWLKARYHKPGNVFLAMVHRLDRPVAGVVLFARTSKAAGRLSRQFRERSVDKQYLAVVGGSVSGDTDRLIDHIERRDRLSRVVPTPTDQQPGGPTALHGPRQGFRKEPVEGFPGNRPAPPDPHSAGPHGAPDPGGPPLRGRDAAPRPPDRPAGTPVDGGSPHAG